MYIQSINNLNPTFNGSYKFTGPWTQQMKEASLPFIEELAKGDKKIVAKMSTKIAFFDKFHHFGQKLYKPSLTAKQEKMSLLEKIKDKLGLLNFPHENITNHFHSANSTTKLLSERLRINEFNLKSYKRRLDITIPAK